MIEAAAVAIRLVRFVGELALEDPLKVMIPALEEDPCAGSASLRSCPVWR